MATSKYDVALAVVENSLSQMTEESVVRLYDVGRIRAEEEDYEDAENDEENEDEGQLSLSQSIKCFGSLSIVGAYLCVAYQVIHTSSQKMLFYCPFRQSSQNICMGKATK